MTTMTRSWLRMTFVFLLAAVLLPVPTSNYKILFIPQPAKSHIFSLAAIAEGLADRGHRVTFLIGEDFPLNLPEQSKWVNISVMRHMGTTSIDETSANPVIEAKSNIMPLAAVISKISQQWCHQLIVDSEDVLEKLEREQFDLAVVDSLLFTRFLYLIPHRLRIPYITYTDAVDPLAIRVPWLPSFVPIGIMPFSDRMTFMQRLQNVAGSLGFIVVLPLYFTEPDNKILDKYRRFGDFRSLQELESKSALWLLTRDNVLDYPRPTMPNMVEVGGLTVKLSTGKLPPGMKKFIDGAEKGVILMTFGSLVFTIPVHMVEKFSSAFQRFHGYRVIWRLNNEHNVKLPDNVMIDQWLPQNDILAHPSVKLFITHCGNNGQFEALYHAVPMIGFPLLADQHYNAKRLDHKGYGISMNLYDFTANELLENMHKILDDNSYKERITNGSEIFRSRVQSPVERATFWIEHVCQFGGDHLRSAGNELPLYSYLMLDVLAFILVAVHIIIYLLYRLLRMIVSKCCRRAASSDISKKNN